MSTTKKERSMSAKGFLHKANGKISADAFLAQHRAWLETGELSELTSPILRKFDEKELLPTPTLEAVKAVVLGHYLATETRKGEEAMARREAQGEKAQKSWIGTIFNKDGQVMVRMKETPKDSGKFEPEELIFSSDFCSEVDRWVDRRLFDGEPDCFGTIQHVSLKNKDGDPLSSVVLRGDAMARILKAPKSPAMRKVGGASTSKLGFGSKAVQSRAHFSKG
jgi:hypothetical protein